MSIGLFITCVVVSVIASVLVTLWMTKDEARRTDERLRDLEGNSVEHDLPGTIDRLEHGEDWVFPARKVM